MAYRTSLCAAALVSALSLSAVAVAAVQSQGSVSGPASGTNVIPSTAFQKEMIEGRSVSSPTAQKTAELMSALVAVGAPGVEGLPGTQSGPEYSTPSGQKAAKLMGSLAAVGAPGIEGAPDTQSGR
jgi:hypothetical protein